MRRVSPLETCVSSNIDEYEENEAELRAVESNARMRFSDIVETGSELPFNAELPSNIDPSLGILTITPDERRWNAMSRQVWQASRLVSLFVFFSFIVGPPLGNYLAHQQIYGDASGWNPFAAYGYETIIAAFIVPVLILLSGYILSRAMTMLNAAESIAAAAQQFISPDKTAAYNAEAVGEVVRSHMVAMNDGLDNALGRLANVEAIIRQHVSAIELAGDAIEQRATTAVERVANERSRLMDLTESLNAHADSFAAAIAERANASVDALQQTDHQAERLEKDFEERLNQLEYAARQAIDSFEALRSTLVESSEEFKNTTTAIDHAAALTEQATARANAAANEAAESAARNAANVAASAQRAATQSADAAEAAIERAQEETQRIAQSALDVAQAQSNNVREAANEALTKMTEDTKSAVDAARADAEHAVKAAEDVAQAAKRAGEAAQKASEDVKAAGEMAEQNANTAMEISESTAQKVEARNTALNEARDALERENKRLETLIDEQRQRADRLAEAIATQTDRLSRLAETQLREQEATARLAVAQNEMQARAEQQAPEERAPVATEKPAPKAAPAQKDQPTRIRKSPPASAHKRSAPPAEKPADRLDAIARDIEERRAMPTKKADASPNQQEKAPKPEKTQTAETRSKGDVSWRDILSAADEAEPIELGAEENNAGKRRENAEEAIAIIAALQDFTYQLEVRLYGEPPRTLQERYASGDRNVFANRLVRLNESDVKRRIRNESARDKNFEKSVHQFLQSFEILLEEATTSQSADEELEEYLSSPLGRVYLLIGATVGYFA